MDLNKVSLIGNLAQDPETRTLPSGQSVALFLLLPIMLGVMLKPKKKRVELIFIAL